MPVRVYTESGVFGAPPEARATPAETPAETLATAEEPTSPALPTDQAELTEAAPETQVEALAALAADAVDAQPGVPSQEHSAPLPDEALDALPDDAAALFGDGDSAQALVSGSVASAETEEMLGDAADAFDAPPELAVMETVPLPEPVVEPAASEPTQTASAEATVPGEAVGPAATIEGGAAATGSGYIVYSVFDNTLLETRLFRIRAGQGEAPQDVSGALDALGAAQDDWITTSPDGAWLLLATQRFDDACAGWACLAVVPADLSSGEAVRTSSDVVHPEGSGAIASGGGLIVFSASGGPHETDLWAISRQGDIWSEPLLLTAQSPYAYHDLPALSTDGASVVFDCGDQPFGQDGTAICEAETDGSTFRVVLTPQDAPAGIVPGGAHHNPSYAPDGSIVFHSRWTEGVWRVGDAGGATPVGSFTSEASPCVLPDGRVASLWTGRAGSAGLSELKIMTADGASYAMLLTDLQIDDIGCGG